MIRIEPTGKNAISQFSGRSEAAKADGVGIRLEYDLRQIMSGINEVLSGVGHDLSAFRDQIDAKIEA